MLSSRDEELHRALCSVAKRYQSSFSSKEFSWKETDVDPLMRMFGVTQDLKDANKQYWGRELGMCWQRLVVTLLDRRCPEFQPPFRVGNDEPCDAVVGVFAIDTKYRSGNGDSGTLKKFRQYGPLLKGSGYTPVMLFLRTDNLPAAITAIRSGGWEVHTGAESFRFIERLTGFDLLKWMSDQAGSFDITKGREGV